MRFTLWLSALLILAALLAPSPLKHGEGSDRAENETAPDNNTPESAAPAEDETQNSLAASDETLCQLLSPAELSREQIVCCMVIRKLLLDRYDSNRNDTLEEEEIRAIRRDARRLIERRAKTMLSRLDSDGDGLLSQDELQRLHSLPEYCQLSPSAAQHYGRSEQDADNYPSSMPIALIAHHLIMTTYDLNGNHRLDADESKRLKEDGEWLCAAREKELIAFCDSDGDGRLSEKEWREAILACGQLRKRIPHSKNPLDHIVSTFYDADIIRTLPHGDIEEPRLPASPPSPRSPRPRSKFTGKFNSGSPDNADSTAPSAADAGVNLIRQLLRRN